MDEQTIRKLMQDGFDEIQPKVESMTTLMMDCYQVGFNTCFKMFIGQNFNG